MKGDRGLDFCTWSGQPASVAVKANGTETVCVPSPKPAGSAVTEPSAPWDAGAENGSGQVFSNSEVTFCRQEWSRPPLQVG